MKNLRSISRIGKLCVAFFLLSFFSTLLQSQSYYVIQYIKVHPTLENDYLNLEKNVWKKIQGARISSGVLDGWYLYRVIAPNGSGTKYNFISVQVYNSSEKLAGHFENYGIDYTKVLDVDEINFALKTPELRDQVYEEVWIGKDLIIKPNAEKLHRFAVFNAMKLKDGITNNAYEQAELKYWKPMHQQRIKMNRMQAWGIFDMIIPGGTEREFHWATVDYYDSFNDIMINNDALFQQIHGAKNAAKYVEETLKTRDLLRAEVRELLDYAN